MGICIYLLRHHLGRAGYILALWGAGITQGYLCLRLGAWEKYGILSTVGSQSEAAMAELEILDLDWSNDNC
jgi:hypothetical protein